MSARPRALAVAALSAVSVVRGFNWVVLKVGVRHADPFEFLAWRFAHAPQVLLVGLLQTTGTFALATWALASGAVGKTAVLNYTMPFWVTLIAWPLLGERPTPAWRASASSPFRCWARCSARGCWASAPAPSSGREWRSSSPPSGSPRARLSCATLDRGQCVQAWGMLQCSIPKLLERMMISELEALFKRIDGMRMTPAERNLAKARLMQAEALANGLHAAFRSLARLIPGRSVPAPRSLDLHAQAPNSRA